ncbi:hypothetical protein Tco_0933192 [Tanacetum coccineum]
MQLVRYRPPLLVEDDLTIMEIAYTRYIRGKPNGKLIWKSIQNGPTPHPMVTDPPPTGSTIVPAPRKKLDSDHTASLPKRLSRTGASLPILLITDLFSIPPSTSSDFLNSRTHATVHEWVTLLLNESGMAHGNVGNTGARGKKYFKDQSFKDGQLKRKVMVLDAEAEAFLAVWNCTATYDQLSTDNTQTIVSANI